MVDRIFDCICGWTYFNLRINLLGAYVHTYRLQFVEFFGKFYEGGGKPFEPFESDTKYVDIKEDYMSIWSGIRMYMHYLAQQ